MALSVLGSYFTARKRKREEREKNEQEGDEDESGTSEDDNDLDDQVPLGDAEAVDKERLVLNRRRSLCLFVIKSSSHQVITLEKRFSDLVKMFFQPFRSQVLITALVWLMI